MSTVGYKHINKVATLLIKFTVHFNVPYLRIFRFIKGAIVFCMYVKILIFLLAKAEAPVLWPPHEKSRLIGKNCDAERDWGQEEKGTTEDEMAGWHHGLDGRESE